MQSLSLLLLAVMVGFVSAPLYGQVGSPAFARSPDHPSTWVVGATNIHQDLRWDDARQMVVADVTYSTRDYADSMHPTHESEYTLAFPSVHLDKSSSAVMVGGTRIGTLSHGIFDNYVRLDPKAELSIHRHHGVIYGAIQPATNE